MQKNHFYGTGSSTWVVDSVKFLLVDAKRHGFEIDQVLIEKLCIKVSAILVH